MGETKSKAKANGQASKKEIALPQIDFRQVTFKIKGISPLVVHKFSEKSINQIKDKQAKKAGKGREKRNPQAEYLAALHMIDKKKTGFPASGVKLSMVRGGKALGMVMADLRGAFHVLPLGGLVEIKGKHKMREDMVRLMGNAADVRYRPEYTDWSAEITLTYNAGVVSEEQLANLLNMAGFGTGLGEMRPEKGGAFGMFQVV
jgi:hypothetical protein